MKLASREIALDVSPTARLKAQSQQHLSAVLSAEMVYKVSSNSADPDEAYLGPHCLPV